MKAYNYYKKKLKEDFAAGVKLLQAHNPGLVTKGIMQKLLLAVISGDVTPYLLGKLTDALRKFDIDAEAEAAKIPGLDNDIDQVPAADTSIEGEEKEGEVGTERDVAPSSGALLYREVPIGNTPLHQLAKTLHKEHSHYHALLVTAETDEARAELAAKIMAITSRLDTVYADLREGKTSTPDLIAAAAANDGKNGADALRKLQSLRSRVSQLRKMVEAPKYAAKKEAYELELKEKLEEIAKLENPE